MNKRNGLICNASLILTISTASGCSSMIIDAGNRTYNHLRGDLLGVVPGKLPEVYTATVTAVETLIQIRIGLIGDKVESEMIYDHIKKYLPRSRGI